MNTNRDFVIEEANDRLQASRQLREKIGVGEMPDPATLELMGRLLASSIAKCAKHELTALGNDLEHEIGRLLIAIHPNFVNT
jgi:hypothetical protein